MSNKTVVPIKRVGKVPVRSENQSTQKNRILYRYDFHEILTPKQREKRIEVIEQDLLHYRNSIFSLITFFMGFEENPERRKVFLSERYRSDSNKEKQLLLTLINIRERVAILQKELFLLQGGYQ